MKTAHAHTGSVMSRLTELSSDLAVAPEKADWASKRGSSAPRLSGLRFGQRRSQLFSVYRPRESARVFEPIVVSARRSPQAMLADLGNCNFQVGERAASRRAGDSTPAGQDRPNVDPSERPETLKPATMGTSSNSGAELGDITAACYGMQPRRNSSRRYYRYAEN